MPPRSPLVIAIRAEGQHVGAKRCYAPCGEAISPSSDTIPLRHSFRLGRRLLRSGGPRSARAAPPSQ